ncbi:MAG: succinate dehydrogenase, cytochrome b556 subunit [Alphaproteobacteria bacterium]|nr:succinate dehydrogenase, cytochrome b556 subunit [Alphaproteobacteria bacterium]
MAEIRSRPRSRPLSPHLQIYRWPVTMATSILHRLTGVGLAIGTLVLAWWLVAASMGSDSYGIFESAAFHWFGRFVLFGFTVALVFHMLNGIRHLFWDVGLGFKVSTANASGIAVFLLTLVLTLAIWMLAYRSMGAW